MPESLSHDKIFIQKLTDIILANLGNVNFGVSELSRESGMSRSGLNRKLQKISKKNVNQFIREVRLHEAYKMLQDGKLNASEVSYRVGFSSPAYFTRCFHQFFGFPPGKTKQRSNGGPDESVVFQEVLISLPKKQDRRTKIVKVLGFIIPVAILFLIFQLLNSKILSRNALDDLRSADGRVVVAVMPFKNMTADTMWDNFQDGIQDMVITTLINSVELKVLPAESVSRMLDRKGLTDYASITTSLANTISRKLDANVFISGSIIKAGGLIRLNAQLQNTKTGEIFKSFQINGTASNVFPAIDTLSLKIQDFILLSILRKKVIPDELKFGISNSAEAYGYYLYGQESFSKSDFSTALYWYLKAADIDTNFTNLESQISFAYYNLGLYDQARAYCLKLYRKKDQMPVFWNIWTSFLYSFYFETPYELIRYSKKLLEFDDQVSALHTNMGYAYMDLFQYENAISELEKGIKINMELNLSPWWVRDYTHLGKAYHETGQFKKEKRLYRQAEKFFPDDPLLISRQMILSLSKGDTVSANDYTRKYWSASFERSVSRADVIKGLADIYCEAGILARAEGYYREALELEPENPERLLDLAYFMINEDVDVTLGLELIEKALKQKPDDFMFLDCKGWGLYKQGRNKDAMELLEKSWHLKPIYNPQINLHLEEVKKSLPGKI